jgi:PTS system nitrogen regulatory IIA component
MQFDLRDVARMLKVPETRVYHWINEEHLPVRQVNGKYSFDQSELLEWATMKRLSIPTEAFHDNHSQASEVSLAAAVEHGGICRDLAGADKAAVLRAVVEAMQLPANFDRAPLLELFLSREQLGSTGVGDGIAIPHPRHPVILPVGHPNVSICFLAQPLEFGSADNKKVDTLFVLVSPTIRTHMQMLARISRALADTPVRQLLRSRGSSAEIIGAIRRIEEAFDEPAPVNGSGQAAAHAARGA